MRNGLLIWKFSGELGDYDIEVHEGNYISEHKLLLKQTESIEEKAMELHQTQLKGFTPEQAETHFLRLASQLDTYAVDPHPVKVSFIFYILPLRVYLARLELSSSLFRRNEWRTNSFLSIQKFWPCDISVTQPI